MSTHRSASTSRMRVAWLWAMGLVSLIALDAVPAEPARLLPASGLTFYVEYDGLDAHSDAWKASAAREILVEKSAGSTMLGVERQILDAIFKVAFSESKMTGADFMALQDHLVSQGFAFATYEDDGESSTVFVLKGFGGQGGLDRFEGLLRGLLRMEPNARFPDPTRSRNRDLRGFGGWKLAGAEPPAPEPPLNPFQSGSNAETSADRLDLVAGRRRVDRRQGADLQPPGGPLQPQPVEEGLPEAAPGQGLVGARRPRSEGAGRGDASRVSRLDGRRAGHPRLRAQRPVLRRREGGQPGWNAGFLERRGVQRAHPPRGHGPGSSQPGRRSMGVPGQVAPDRRPVRGTRPVEGAARPGRRSRVPQRLAPADPSGPWGVRRRPGRSRPGPR